MSDATIKMWTLVVIMIMGFCAIARHNQLGLQAYKFQKEVFHIELNEKWIQRGGVGYLIVGIFFVIFGLLQLLNVLQK